MKTRNSHGLLQLGREALAYCQCASALISGNKALFVSVDLIGEKNPVILEFNIIYFAAARRVIWRPLEGLCTNLDFIVTRIKTCYSGAFYYGIKNWKERPRNTIECKRKRCF